MRGLRAVMGIVLIMLLSSCYVSVPSSIYSSNGINNITKSTTRNNHSNQI